MKNGENRQIPFEWPLNACCMDQRESIGIFFLVIIEGSLMVLQVAFSQAISIKIHGLTHIKNQENHLNPNEWPLNALE